MYPRVYPVMGIQPVPKVLSSGKDTPLSLCQMLNIIGTMETKTSTTHDTGKEPINFDYCKRFNQEAKETLRDVIKARYGRSMEIPGIFLCGFKNPYKELKNVLSQHYNHSADMSHAIAKEMDYLTQIRQLTHDNSQLRLKVDKLEIESESLKEERTYSVALSELLDISSIDEWIECLGNVLDDLISGMDTRTDCGESLYHVRTLQKFFIGLSKQ